MSRFTQNGTTPISNPPGKGSFILKYHHLCIGMRILAHRVVPHWAAALFLILATLAGGCRKPVSEDVGREVRARLETAEKMADLSQFEEAARLGFEALSLAESSRGVEAKRLAGESHTVLSRVYLLALQDSLAWDHACAAEELSQQVRSDSLLSVALCLKGRICSYVGISPETARDDEGVGYTMQALGLAEKGGYTGLEADACYQLSELYVNKNRWNAVWVPEFYKQAGEWLKRAESLDPEVPSVRSMKYHFRYLRQDGNTEEAVAYCLRIMEQAAPDDHRLRYHLHNHLTTLYLRLGDIDRATASHRAYAREMREYIRQKEDLTMQELRLQYDTRLKDQQIRTRTLVIGLLGALLLLAMGAVFVTVRLNRKISRQNERIRNVSRSRELLFGAIAQEMEDPSLEGVRDPGVLEFFRQWSTLDEDEIVCRCKALTEGEDALDPAVARYVANLMLSRKKALSETGLSAREREIIALSKEGLTDKQIADRLFISTRTVSNHKYHIYGKLDVKSNAEMLKKAQELGL